MWTPIHILLFFFPLIFLFLSHPRMNNRQSNNSHISRKSVPIAISPIVRYPKSCRDQSGNPYIIIIIWMKLCGMKWMNPSAYISASSSRRDVYTHTFIFLSFFWLSWNTGMGRDGRDLHSIGIVLFSLLDGSDSQSWFVFDQFEWFTRTTNRTTLPYPPRQPEGNYRLQR